MSMLLEKRQAIVNKINTLIAERNNAIEEKVSIYRTQLESEPVSKELLDAKHILSVIDEVIAYDTAESAQQVQTVEVAHVEEVIQPEVFNNVEESVETCTNVAPQQDERPGMTAIITPERS